jgi:hypothetical protein
MATKADARLRVGADVSQAKKAIDTLQGDVSNLNGTVKSGQERIEKFATAVTGTASVLGGLGSKAGATAGAVSNLATAFVAGGPLLAGMALATSATATLVSAFQEISENTHQADGAFKALGQQLQSTAEKEILQTKKAIADLETQLRNFGMSATEIALANAEAQGAAQRMALETINKNLPKREAALAKLEKKLEQAERAGVVGEIERLRKVVEPEREIIEKLKIRKQFNEEAIKQNTILIDKLNDQLDTLEAQAKQAKERNKSSEARSKKEAKETQDQLAFIAAIQRQYGQVEKNIEAARKQREREARERGQALKEAFKELDSFNKEEERLRAKRMAEAQKHADELLKLEQDRLKEEERLKQESLRREMDMRREAAEEIASFSIGMLQVGMQATLDLLEAGIKNQRIEWDKFTGAIIKSIGQQVFGVGAKYFIEGAGMIAASKGVDPAGYATLAVGALGMTVGGGMMATGTVLGAGVLSGNTAGSGSSNGGALGGGALAPRGGTGGGVGDAADREAVVINFNGGTQLGDPTERALTMARDQRRARRTVYMPRGG